MACTKHREQIDRFIDGELEMRPQVELFRHLASCAECQARIDGLIRMKEALRSERIPYPRELDDAILGRIQRETPARVFAERDTLPRRSVWNRPVGVPLHLTVTFAAVMIALGVLLGRVVFPSTDTQQHGAPLPAGFAQPQTVILMYGMPPVEVLGTPAARTLERIQ